MNLFRGRLNGFLLCVALLFGVLGTINAAVAQNAPVSPVASQIEVEGATRGDADTI